MTNFFYREVSEHKINENDQTVVTDIGDEDTESVKSENTPEQEHDNDELNIPDKCTLGTNNDSRYPRRIRRSPDYLSDYVTSTEETDVHAMVNVDYCYRISAFLKTTLTLFKPLTQNIGLKPWRVR